jgi:hypothetical protein
VISVFELAKECQDAEIWNISVSSTCFILDISRKPGIGKESVSLILPRALDLEFKPDLD